MQEVQFLLTCQSGGPVAGLLGRLRMTELATLPGSIPGGPALNFKQEGACKNSSVRQYSRVI